MSRVGWERHDETLIHSFCTTIKNMERHQSPAAHLKLLQTQLSLAVTLLCSRQPSGACSISRATLCPLRVRQTLKKGSQPSIASSSSRSLRASWVSWRATMSASKEFQEPLHTAKAVRAAVSRHASAV